MSDCLRLRVLKAITTALKTISPANGFEDDVSDAVFRGRAYYGADDPLPMIGLIEPPVSDDPLYGRADSTVNAAPWSVIVQGFVRDDKMNPTDPGYRLQSAVRKVLAAEKARTGVGGDRRTPNILGMEGAVTKLEIGSPIVRPSDDISTVAYFWILIRITLVEDLSSD